MKKLTGQTVLAAAVAFAIGISASKAAPIVQIDSRALFDASITNETTVNFDSIIVPADSTYAFFQPTLTQGSTTFSAASGMYVPTAAGFGPGDGSQYLVPASLLTISPTASTALGFEIFSLSVNQAGSMYIPISVSGTVTDSLGNTFDFTATAPALTGAPSVAFIGFIDTVGATIVSVTYTGDGSPALDNVSSGLATVPEPSSVALMVVGGMALTIFGFRRSTRGKVLGA